VYLWLPEVAAVGLLMVGAVVLEALFMADLN
jgi:hypothetical protein